MFAAKTALAGAAVMVVMDSAAAQERYNVVMLAMDDLRPVGTAFGEPEVLMPNLDKLAARSTVFLNAYAQSATCGISRSSLLTSRRPDTTQVLGNNDCPFTTQPAHASWVSLPEYFAKNGYSTHGFGKIFHPDVCEGAAVGEQKAAWTDPYYHAPCISLGSIYNHTCYESHPGPLPEGPGGKVTSVFANQTVDSEEDMPDAMIAARSIAVLQSLADRRDDGSDQPFFAAIGFHKPHLPHIAPQEYFDLYPPESVSLPPAQTRRAPVNLPPGAWNGCGEFKTYKDVANFTSEQKFSQHQPLDDDTTRAQRRAYFAAASFVDAQVGKVLDALESTGLANNTVVALWGDHGWHVGENNEWAKHTAMTRANRAPLLFALPTGSGGGASAGKVISDGFAEMVDIYPTLADLAGLHVPIECSTDELSLKASNCTEGKSLAELVKAEESQTPMTGKPAAFYQWQRYVGGKRRMGYTVHMNLPKELDESESEIRYTEWAMYNTSKTGPHGPIWPTDLDGIVEMYNRTADPDENFNIVVESQPTIVAHVRSVLHAGWRIQE